MAALELDVYGMVAAAPGAILRDQPRQVAAPRDDRKSVSGHRPSVRGQGEGA